MTSENLEAGNGQTEKGNYRGLIKFFVIEAIILGFIFLAITPCLRFNTRDRQSEAKTNMGALFTTQVAYFGEYGTYAGGPNCFEDLGWGPEGETKYTYWCGGDFIAPTKPGAEIQECVNVRAVSSRDGFTMCAAGNIDDDDVIDTWSMRDSKNLRHDNDDHKKAFSW